MKKKIVLAALVVSFPVALAFYLWGPAAPVHQALGQAQGPEIVLYTGENFSGRAIRVLQTAFDLPRQEEPDGSLFDWNDKVRSLIVRSGTWRLYQNGRCNTRLDDTKIARFDIRTKLPAGGWSTLLSATSTGQLEIPDLAAGGVGSDISSVELVSEANLPDWALVLRKP